MKACSVHRTNHELWHCYMALALVFLFFWDVPAEAQSRERLGEALRMAAPEKPFEVGIGIRVDQVAGIDQKAENFVLVGDLRMQWDDANLAFEPGETGYPFKMLSREEFVRVMDENAIFAPAFAIHNQQDRRFTQTAGVILLSDGHANYGERFTVRLQAPEFDFTQYPFDRQMFFIHVQAVYPVEFMRFVPLIEFSRLGEQLGEEEWIFETSWTEVTEVQGTIGLPTSRFTFGFEARRHLTYYLLRIFVPLAVIIVVSWLTFFLQDYSQRVGIAGANLLVFVAFNFTIANDLPRLGYITFMDAVIAMLFVFSGLVVIINVVFKRLESSMGTILVRRIDAYILWIYPLVLVMLGLFCWYWFMIVNAPV